MTPRPLISVIVPVYNTAEFLPACIKSLLSQTYRDMEFILVDDGSADDSLAICQRYALLDRRIKVLSQKNTGAASARNAGLSVACGKYIGFVDSDDTISCHTYQSAVDAIIRSDADFVLWNMESKMESVPAGLTRGPLYQELIFQTILSKGVGPSVCDKLFKREVIHRANIHFREGLRCVDDFFFSLEYVMASSSVYYLSDKFYYFYSMNPQSLTHTFYPDEWLYPIRVRQILEDVLQLKTNPQYVPYANARFALDIAFILLKQTYAANISFTSKMAKIRDFMRQTFVRKNLHDGYEAYMPRQLAYMVDLLKKGHYQFAYLLAFVCRRVSQWRRKCFKRYVYVREKER